MKQLDLPAVEPEGPRKPRTISERFEAFHAENLEVYDEILEEAEHMQQCGMTRGSMNMIFERLRSKHSLSCGEAQKFKLNNSFRALYARMVMAENTCLRGFFRVRG